jgi:hypothetical protein
MDLALENIHRFPVQASGLNLPVLDTAGQKGQDDRGRTPLTLPPARRICVRSERTFGCHRTHKTYKSPKSFWSYQSHAPAKRATTSQQGDTK